MNDQEQAQETNQEVAEQTAVPMKSADRARFWASLNCFLDPDPDPAKAPWVPAPEPSPEFAPALVRKAEDRA